MKNRLLVIVDTNSTRTVTCASNRRQVFDLTVAYFDRRQFYFCDIRVKQRCNGDQQVEEHPHGLGKCVCAAGRCDFTVITPLWIPHPSFQIIHTGFLQPSFSVLEDSNLEAFFKAYRLKFPSTITEDNVYAFLKHRFPKFAFHHFDDDGLCSAEFVFVYSLLLHYGCVQCRDVQIQNACKSLGEYQQAAVANFFKQFAGVKYEGVVRGSLRKMIVDAMRTDDQVANVALSTPKKRLSGSPDTPKNLRLEQNMKDLNKIRVQLETERYEKGFLEIQLKEGQDQITRLNAQQKVHINEIHELRNQLLYENDENRTPNLNDGKDKQTSEVNAMRRNIGQLEDKVANLLVETHCLEADKGTLAKKLKHSEEQIQLLFERSEEMATLIDQLQGEVNVS